LNFDNSSPLRPIIRKLSGWNALSEDDRAAILGLPYVVRNLSPNQFIIWDGDRPQHSTLLLSGFAYRHKVVGSGGRQIFSIHMKGDVVDLQNSLLGRADHNVQMITQGEVALVPIDAIRKLAFDRPAVGMALWYETLVEGSMFREWITNIGRRDARMRVAHLLCECAIRLEAAGLGNAEGCTLPLTQEQLADAVSLTPIHINRTLKGLAEDGMIVRARRSLTIPDWRKMAKLGDFDPAYLHLADEH
jgi:CRP-like cAMP-binding protein